MTTLTHDVFLGAPNAALLEDAFRLSYDALSRTGDRRFRGQEEVYARQAVARLVAGLGRRGADDPRMLSCAVIRQMNAL